MKIKDTHRIEGILKKYPSELIADYLLGNLTPEELQNIHQLIQQDPELGEVLFILDMDFSEAADVYFSNAPTPKQKIVKKIQSHWKIITSLIVVIPLCLYVYFAKKNQEYSQLISPKFLEKNIILKKTVAETNCNSTDLEDKAYCALENNNLKLAHTYFSQIPTITDSTTLFYKAATGIMTQDNKIINTEALAFLTHFSVKNKTTLEVEIQLFKAIALLRSGDKKTGKNILETISKNEYFKENKNTAFIEMLLESL